MGLIDFLKKIGVLRMGSQTWQGDASNRPVDLDGYVPKCQCGCNCEDEEEKAEEKK